MPTSKNSTASPSFVPQIIVVAAATDASSVIARHFPQTAWARWRQLNTTDQPLTAENTRELVAELSYAPGTEKALMVVLNAEKMSAVIQNTLLKTLEEMPANTQLVALACELDPLLPTLRSRCQIIYDETAVAGLQGSLTNEQKTTLTALLSSLQQAKINDCITLGENYSDREEALTLLHQLITLVHQQITEHPTHRKQQQLQQLLTTRNQLMANINVRLALESCFFALRG